MKPSRSILLAVSAGVVLLMLAGGLAVKVGAGESSYHEVVVFSEILNLVLENYVDPVESGKLLSGAYEGMLGGLDAHGAFLTPDEVAVWKQQATATAITGVSVLKAGNALQVVAVEPDSPAEEAGILVGDQIRTIDGQPVRDLSLQQAWRLLAGAPKSRVELDLLQPSEGFRSREIELIRDTGRSEAHSLTVRRGIGLLAVRDLRRIDVDELGQGLKDLGKRQVDHLLIDLRNVADFHPREAAPIAGLFASGTLLRLRDRNGRLTAVLESSAERAWNGSISVLVNGATAGSGEALASVLQSVGDCRVLGESTYGLGAEPRLFELEDGSGLLVSAELWETGSGAAWNADGVQPDEVVRGRGDDYAAMIADQLEKVLDLLTDQAGDASTTREAA